MTDLILSYLSTCPGSRKREIAHSLKVWQCNTDFLNTMRQLEKDGKIYSIYHSDPANMEFYDEWYIKENN